MTLTLDQAGALPNSLSPNTAEDGPVIEKVYSPHVRESNQDSYKGTLTRRGHGLCHQASMNPYRAKAA
jgi:hypothetical protein